MRKESEHSAKKNYQTQRKRERKKRTDINYKKCQKNNK